MKFWVVNFFSLFQKKITQSLKCRTLKWRHLWVQVDLDLQVHSFQGYFDPEMTLCCNFCGPRGALLFIFFSITWKNVFLFEICVQRFMFSLVFSRWFYMGINHNLLMPPGICFFNFHFWVTLFVSHLKYMGHFWVIVNFEPTSAMTFKCTPKWTQWCWYLRASF